MAVCDFCSQPDPAWIFLCPSYTAEILPGIRAGSEGSWAACEACKLLIEMDKRRVLVRRAAMKIATKFSTRLADVEPIVAQRFQEFFDHKLSSAPLTYTEWARRGIR